MFCVNCGTKLVDGATCNCTAKSTAGLNTESLEKALNLMEDLAKGVRPGEGKAGADDKRTAKKIAEEVRDQVKGYGEHGEGDSEEQPKTKKGVEEAAKKGGFMPPEAEEEEEDPRDRERFEDEEGAEPEFKSAKGKKGCKKSFADELLEQDTVKKAVDVSDFLEAVVYQLGDMTDSLRSDVSKSINFAGYQQQFNVGMAKAMQEMGSLLKSLSATVESLGKTPAAVRKSEQSVAAIEKSFAGGSATNDTLTKSQIAAKLTELWEAGDKTITEADIIRAESTGYVPDALKAKVEGK